MHDRLALPVRRHWRTERNSLFPLFVSLHARLPRFLEEPTGMEDAAIVS